MIHDDARLQIMLTYATRIDYQTKIKTIVAWNVKWRLINSPYDVTGKTIALSLRKSDNLNSSPTFDISNFDTMKLYISFKEIYFGEQD